jgi:flagellar basal body-associated protein FliL
MTKNKKAMGALGWIIIIIVIIAIGIGAYFLFTGDSSPIAGGRSSIPQPPALPSG